MAKPNAGQDYLAAVERAKGWTDEEIFEGRKDPLGCGVTGGPCTSRVPCSSCIVTGTECVAIRDARQRLKDAAAKASGKPQRVPHKACVFRHDGTVEYLPD